MVNCYMSEDEDDSLYNFDWKNDSKLKEELAGMDWIGAQIHFQL